MKYLVFTITSCLLLVFTGCTELTPHKELTEEVKVVLDDIESITQSKDPSQAIFEFQEKANEQADEVTNLRKSNMAAFFEKANYYEHCIITVGEHTIVRVVDLEDCETSGSWATCMPLVEGYIRKGNWVYKKDYANQIIGLPDDQKRFAYLFNELEK